MQALKVILFFLSIAACLFLLFFYVGWSLVKIVIFLGIASIFTGVAYYFYKNMFTEDE